MWRPVHRAEDGSIRLLCNLDKEMMLGKWYVYASTDGGRRWMQEETPWLDGLGELLTVEAAGMGQGGQPLHAVHADDAGGV